jgi:DNA-binding SARP family transcriptional activator
MTVSGVFVSVRDDTRPVTDLRLILLGGFALLLDGREAYLATNAQRVLAWLCVGRRTHLAEARSVLAERLWTETTVERAQASLRTALWRIRQADTRLVATVHDHVRLGSQVRVDVHDSLAQAERLLSDHEELAVEDARIEPLTQDLLPGWDDDWLLLERERVRQIHLHALEALSARLCACGRFHRAVDAGIAAVAAEPLRESAHNALIAAHLGEGNVAEAHRQYRRYRQMLWDELRLSPLHTFEELISRSGGRDPSRVRLSPMSPQPAGNAFNHVSS